MKRIIRFGWHLLPALIVVITLSITGCQTGSAWRSDGGQGLGKAGAKEDAPRERPCRFG